MSDTKPSKTSQKDEVYHTIVQPRPETIQHLTGWKRPKYAYVLFETKEWHISHDGQRKPATGLMTLNAESRPEIAHQVEFYLRKGYRLIDYGNFPKLSDPNPARAAKATHYSQGAGINPWDSLEQFIKQKMASEIGWDEKEKQYESELNALRRKLAEEQSKRAVRESVLPPRQAAQDAAAPQKQPVRDSVVPPKQA